MEVKLDSLIEKIRKDGVAKADTEAQKIIDSAEKKAADIVASARRDAEQILEDAKTKAEKLQQTAEAALQQSARDTVLVTREKLTALLDRVFRREIGRQMKPEFMQSLLLKIVENWGKDSEVTVILNDKDRQALEELLFSKAREGLKEQITIRVDNGISDGFRIGKKEGDVYYDLTDESLAAFLQEFLSPSIRNILDKDNA